MSKLKRYFIFLFGTYSYRNDKRKRNKKLNRQQYKAELENQIKSNIQHQTQQHEIENIDILSSRNGVKIQAKNDFFDYPTQNEEIGIFAVNILTTKYMILQLNC